MSAMGDVLGGIKKILVIDEAVARIEKEIDALGNDLRRTRDYAEAIDGRVRRLEGFIEGVTAATSQSVRLSKD